MSKFYFPKIKGFHGGERLTSGTLNIFPLLIILFTMGLLAGGIFGLFSNNAVFSVDFETYVSADAVPKSFFGALWNSGRFFLLLFVASTSFLGVLVLPAAVALRGYLIGCSASALYAVWSYRGLLCAFAVCGLPSLLTVPCFMVAACDAFFLSSRILKLRGLELSAHGNSILRHFPFYIFAIIFETLYSLYILPSVLGGI